jgi:hypothetical protein
VHRFTKKETDYRLHTKTRRTQKVTYFFEFTTHTHTRSISDYIYIGKEFVLLCITGYYFETVLWNGAKQKRKMEARYSLANTGEKKRRRKKIQFTLCTENKNT